MLEAQVCFQELLDLLEHSELKKELKKAKEDLYKDKKLIDMIKEYHNNPNDDLRHKIYEKEAYKNYKKWENKLNFLILQSNQILRRLKDENC